MNSTEQITATFQSIEDLVSALSEGERTSYHDIIRSLEIPSTIFDKFSSWSQESYTRNCIIDCEAYELILLCWEPGQKTPIHDHGGEECWVRVIEGNFRETIYKEDGDGILNSIRTNVAKANDITYMIDFMGFHCLENLSSKRSMTLHLYAKPIRSCNLYDKNTGDLVNKNLVYNTKSNLTTK